MQQERTHFVYILASKPQGTLTPKLWPRAWMINLIEGNNPHWTDLFGDV